MKTKFEYGNQIKTNSDKLTSFSNLCDFYRVCNHELKKRFH